MMAAIAASANGAKVTIIEQNPFPGKKILSTGNGRCNYTNFVQNPSCYRSDDPQFPWQVIRQFDEQKTVGFLKDLGICPKERNGYLYPNSDQAQAVADALIMECERLSVRMENNTSCLEILPLKQGFLIKTETIEHEELKKGIKEKKKNMKNSGRRIQKIRACDAVILAAGSKASNISGSDGSEMCIRDRNNTNTFTPMMQKYLETKEQYKDCILFYRLGDFYEMFFDDAITVSRELEITLTGKSCGQEERAPMCGVPYHAVDGYLTRLVAKGYKVAICDQVEDPKQAKGLVKREVTRIVTPGTILDAQAIDETKNNYIMCIVYIADRYGVSVADITTGDYFVTELPDGGKLKDEIYRFMPSEIICNEAFYMSGQMCIRDSAYTVINENTPEFSEKTTKVFTKLSELDSLGRCGVAYGCYGPETIAEVKRGAIGHIRPSGWKTVKYPDLIDGNYLYNRCHLIMWKLSGILDDERNLITGTRYMNTEGMLPFEEKIVNYVEDTGHHVMYRVTPV